jgi:hypothetical protein
MRPAILMALLVGLLLGGCTTPSAWKPVDIGDVRPSALAAGPDAMLVAGASGSGPALLRLDAAGTTRFELDAAEPYAAQATLVVVAGSGSGVDAVGTVVGGAHGNPRWTVWDGTANPPRLASRPQEFFTFGGHDAGPLFAALETPSGPIIAGSRTTNSGSRAVLYVRNGSMWTPTPSPSALSSTAEVQLGFSAAAMSGERMIIAGDELLLSGGLDQRPAVWIGSGGDWHLIELPTSGITGTGLSRATSIACGPSGCWLAGWVRGHPVAWTLDPATGAATLLATLPGDVPAGNDPRALITVVGSIPVVATNASTPSIQAGCPSGWRALATPGPVSALAASGSSLYAIAGDVLNRLDAPAC